MHTESELVFRPGFRRQGWTLGVAASLAVSAPLMARRGVGWMWLFFGLAAALALFMLWLLTAPRMRLRLSHGGFAYGTAWRRYFLRWSDIAYFTVRNIGPMRLACFVFSPGYQGDERVRAINQDFGGFDRFLPDTYGMGAEALAELLEEWRLRHTADGQQRTITTGIS